MNRIDFIDKLNEITKETNSPVLYHKTKFEYLESILKNGALLPLNSRENLNTNLLSDNFSNMRKDIIEKYKSSIFVSLKTSNITLRPKNFFLKDNFPKNRKDFDNYDDVIFIIDPYSIDEKIFESSHICFDWHYGRFHSRDCRKWNNDKSLDYNLDKWEKFLYKKYLRFKNLSFDNYNEIVIRHPEGINLKSVLNKNSKGVMIVIRSKKPESHFKDLMEKHSEFVWIILK
jgi:hypothetical protein